mmetsp:Transcript_30079/g.58900  ORF Transcript_30079/g.58900 Transcript_30079/m.58900 type:complete len:179 (+) Transcript_30079:224-760(+)
MRESSSQKADLLVQELLCELEQKWVEMDTDQTGLLTMHQLKSFVEPEQLQDTLRKENLENAKLGFWEFCNFWFYSWGMGGVEFSIPRQIWAYVDPHTPIPPTVLSQWFLESSQNTTASDETEPHEAGKDFCHQDRVQIAQGPPFQDNLAQQPQQESGSEIYTEDDIPDDISIDSFPSD